MKISRETVGVTTGHEMQGATLVDAYTLDTGRGLAIVVWTYGATLIEVRIPDRHGRIDNVVVRFPDLDSYQDRGRNPFVGATLGRFARCIAGGRFRLDEQEYELERNFGQHHFHGGPIGFDRYVWEAEIVQEADHLGLHLRLESPAGDQGYPGTLTAETVYWVHPDNRLSFEHRATTTASTVVALTNHAFWNLSGGGTIDAHCLALNASHVIPADGEHIPTGPPVSIIGTPLDYSMPRPIADRRLDHCFALDDPSWAAELFDAVSGRRMRVITDQPGLAVYSGDAFSRARAGLCLQTGAWPDAPNHPDYPSSRLDPGMVYRHHATHEFSLR